MLRHLEEAIGTHDGPLTVVVHRPQKVSFHLVSPVLHSAAVFGRQAAKDACERRIRP